MTDDVLMEQPCVSLFRGCGQNAAECRSWQRETHPLILVKLHSPERHISRASAFCHAHAQSRNYFFFLRGSRFKLKSLSRDSEDRVRLEHSLCVR